MTVVKGRCLQGDALVACELVIEAGLVSAIEPLADDFSLPIISPGFIDLQVNGAADKLLNATPDIDSLERISETLLKTGTTAWLPTVVTDTTNVMMQLAEAVAELRQNSPAILGAHFEGPHINSLKKGVHRENYIRPPSSAELAIYQREDLGCRLLTLAPESIDVESLRSLKESGCILSMGHTAATFEQANQALKNGISSATHLFNAMSGLDSRNPGVVAATMASNIAYGMILDGEHVHPAMARIAFDANPNMYLVTDAMPLLGSDKSEFNWFGETITKQDNRLTDADGRLAGACISQLQALQNAITFFNITIAQALLLVTRNPAQLLGVYPYYGAICVGSRADLVALDDSANLLGVWSGGEPVALT